MMRSWLRWPRLLAVILVTLAVILGVLLVALIAHYNSQRDQLLQQAFSSAQTQAFDAARTISSTFADVMAIASDVSFDLTTGDLPYADITERLYDEVEAHPDIDGLAITFQPFVYDPAEPLYQEYIYKTPEGTFDTLIGASYDYSQPPTDAPDSPQTAWYHGPLNNGPMWNEPFFATGAQKVLIEFGIPFYQEIDDERIAAGVVTIDYSVADMRDLVAGLNLGATGYGFVISPSGTILAHPVPDLVATQTIFDYAESIDNETLADASQRALAGEQVTLELVDNLTGEASWLFMEPVPMTDWALGVVLNRAEYAPDSKQTLREQTTILLVAAVLLLIAISLLVRLHRGRRRALWAVSVAFSLIGIVLIVAVWYLADLWSGPSGVIKITSQTALDSYLTNYEERSQIANGERPLRVPTGVFVQAVQFPDPMSVTVNGYIWQRYPVDSDVPRGFSLPQRIGEEATLEEVHREVQDDEELIIWYIGVTLRQLFDPQRYPFDSRDVTIRLMPMALAENIVLTPDLESYALVSPGLLPGLDIDVGVNNWNMENSAFSYAEVTYNSTLGLSQRANYTQLPELRFTIAAQRYVIGPFIAYLLPGMVAAMMLFAFLVNEHDPGEKAELSEALNYAAALFFVIAVAHTALRDGIAAVGLTYLEHLYILLYITIIAIGLNTYVLVKQPKAWIVQYQNNLIVKLLFWPMLIGALLVSTLAVFVYG
ncbi:MAG: hypothetical protein CL607_19525 [Anaerolineaceae bacterium]|nr:hypothetical protein [Anaerolineaceae bacterium]